MEIHKLPPNVTALVRDSDGPNVGLIETAEGHVLIDTASREADVLTFLDSVGVTPDDVCLVFVTHSHSDHTGGIPVFDRPILSHTLTRQRIIKRGTDRAKQQVPTEVFEDRREMVLGSVKIEFIHAGGHTPGSSVVWLPEFQILFAGDLIFSDIYPFLNVANVPDLMAALEWLLTIEAQVIVPGHGPICDKGEVARQLNYLQSTWARTAYHIAKGHTLEETLADPDYPKYSERSYERKHTGNIKVMYRQVKKSNP